MVDHRASEDVADCVTSSQHHTLEDAVGDPASRDLVGRDEAVEYIRGFVADAAHHGGALLISGDAGVGKTALLEVAATLGPRAGARVIKAAGAEFEAELSFSSLNLILRPLLGGLAELPLLYREALSVALGLEAGTPSDRLILANAVLELLRDAASEQPILLIVDDLPWLDRASALVLGTVVRRLEGTGVGFIAALRTDAETFFDRAGLRAYELGPLDEASGRELLSRRFPDLSPRVTSRLITEAEGNALALLELPIALGEFSRRGGGSDRVLPLTERLRDVFASRLDTLPESTNDLLLLAVLDGSGDLELLERAAPSGAGLGDIAPAERAAILRTDAAAGRLVFRHPLMRSAVVANSTGERRRAAHSSLAASVSDPARRAWHLAEAATGPDEEVASLLEIVAHDHLRRGDAVNAVAEISRAAELSPSSTDRARRWAEAAYFGATVLGDIHSTPKALDDLRRMDPDHVGSLAGAVATAYYLLNGDADFDTAHRLLVGAIESAPDPGDVNDDTLLEAVYNLLEVCFFRGKAELWEPFYRALDRFEPDVPTFLRLLANTIPDPARTAVKVLDLLDETTASLAHESNPVRIMRTAVASSYVDRLPQCRSALWRLVEDGRAGGAITMSIHALALLGYDFWLTGQWDKVAEVADEGISVCDAHGFGMVRWAHRSLQALLASGRGDSAGVEAATDELMNWALPRRAIAMQNYTLQAVALGASGRGDFAGAYKAACAISPAGAIASHAPHATWVIFDVVEAAVRTGRSAEALAHVAAAQECGLPAISARLALVTYGAAGVAASSDSEAKEWFERALVVPGIDECPFDTARVRLAFGERLRRSKSRAEARQYLVPALEEFERLGARPWEARARSELRATGVAVGRTPEAGPGSLTPQQLEIARLAAAGLSNKEIGEQLALSPRTVGTHLYQIFPKLGITSRAGISDAIKDLIVTE